MEEKERENDLYVPKNCSPLEYVVEGFTITEIGYISIIGIIVALIAVFMYVKCELVFQSVFLFIFIVSAAILFFRRDAYSENCIDKIKIISSYFKSQKRYEYKYKNIYESEIPEEAEDKDNVS